MIRRSWFRLAMGNAGLAVASALVALIASDPRIIMAMVANALGSAGLTVWALRKDDGNVD